MYHDLRVGFALNDSVDLYVGADNVTDELPPLGFTGTGAGSGIYSNTGRFFYGGVKWQF
jgi:outer membrane receptor protein involved in Fe transport